MYEKSTSVSCHIYNGLFSIGEDGFETRIITRFCKLFGRYKILKENFISSAIIHVQRTQNIKADRLARNAKNQPSYVVHMDAELPIWFTESV